MSRIDEAIQRARLRDRSSTEAAVGRVPHGAPSEELFSGPWQVAAEDKITLDPPALEPVPEEPGSVPLPAALRVRKASSPGIHPDLVDKVVATDGMPPVAAEQYRKLAAKLHHAQLERGLKTVMIVSALPGEGKTLTSVNLALTLSRSYLRRVLLIDADLRRPRLHEVFGLPVSSGLREAASNERGTAGEAAIVELESDLAVLLAGRPTSDPVGVLASARMRRVLEEAKVHYDWVIIDTAPLAVLPDADVLRDVADTAILVIAADQSSYDLVERAVLLLGRDRIMGAVLNGVDMRQLAGYYDYSPYYHPRA
jgi:capsular exopolysaccharide synthesis family protein